MESETCGCKCGGIPSPGKRFIVGHNLRLLKDYHSQRMTEYNHTRKGVPRTEEWKQNMRKPKPEGFSEKVSENTKKQWQNPIFRNLMLETVKKTNQKIKESGGPRRRIRKNVGPNGLEKEFLEFSKWMGCRDLFVGNGRMWIGGKNPDFIDLDSGLLIELFGSYWHKPEEEQSRTEHFKKHGWDCLVLWDYELAEWKRMTALPPPTEEDRLEWQRMLGGQI